MKFSIPLTNIAEASIFFTRTAGYLPDPGRNGTREGEERFVRPLRGAPYPRLHLSITERSGSVLCSLHLDQKRPSYGGSHAHSADYDGPVLEEEALRISRFFPAPNGTK